jgi:pimeloyl-ACP methyl ester carboxylesterase
MIAPRPSHPSGFTISLLRHRSSRGWVVMLPGAGATTAVWSAQVRAFSRHFNLALVDFPGHRRRRDRLRSLASDHGGVYSFDGLLSELRSALDREGIGACHVVALSLGTILARAWARREPDRLRSAVLAGTIADLRGIPRLLLRCGWYARRALPYMMMYRAYAWIIMPGSSHERTRRMFYRDARWLGRREFNRWFDLAPEATALLQTLRDHRTRVPTLHVMGANDYMFLAEARRLAAAEGSSLRIVNGVGHVCTVEAPAEFNACALQFIERHA